MGKMTFEEFNAMTVIAKDDSSMTIQGADGTQHKMPTPQFVPPEEHLEKIFSGSPENIQDLKASLTNG